MKRSNLPAARSAGQRRPAHLVARLALGALAALALALALGAAAPTPALAADSGSQQMHRLYNPYSGEHFYTASASERDALVGVGWRYEGVGWTAPRSSSTPVYRLYNRYAGDHHYTTSASERDMLVGAGWTYEGVGWYSSDARSVAVWRQYNPYARTGTHNYTTSRSENDMLVRLGWRAEGVGWYGIASSSASTTSGTPIMGSSQASEYQMVKLYKDTVGASAYPYTSNAAAPTIEAFVHVLCLQASSEGVRADVVFAQCMLETNWLRFGGAVSKEQYNFAGIGATGGGNPGNSFPSIHTGLLAQVQHLKAYASTDELNNGCVDPRFNYVTRGCAPTVEGLSNRWAASSTYADKIKRIMAQLQAV